MGGQDKSGRAGIHHVGLSTYRMDETIAFYTEKLGWKVVMNDYLHPGSGGRIRHVFLDTGDGSYFAFLSPENVPGIPEKWATDISSAMGGVPSGFYHFALWVDDEQALRAKQKQLRERGVDVSPVMNHDFAKSIYFYDPVNGLKLEYCATIREWRASDTELTVTKVSFFEDDEPNSERWLKQTAMA
jgi:catechol 2,3-dioxygenase-like lactoylglutathione lyase family enzyme